MEVSAKDKAILRALAYRKAEIAALPVQNERRRMWARLNKLQRVKPMVWITEIPWHEFDRDGDLELRTQNQFCREIERELRRTIYQWEHIQGDLIVEDVMFSPLAIHDTGFGITEDVDIAITDSNSDIYSRHFHVQIDSEADFKKIETPRVWHDEDRTEQTHALMCDVFEGILPVVKRGLHRLHFAPWDAILRWTGVQEALRDLVDRPGYLHLLMQRMLDAQLHRLDQYEKQCLLSLNNCNVRVGSGAYGFTDELPAQGHIPDRVRAADLWGSSTAQIFAVVSPQMHKEFALDHERRWLERFGLTYYGCCEPLHDRIHTLAEIPNLRKVSMSAWIDVNAAVDNVAGRYVFSLKPNPAFLAVDDWQPEAIRADLETKLTAARDCVVEVVLKDISTVRRQPHRLWDWARVAAAVTEAFA